MRGIVFAMCLCLLAALQADGAWAEGLTAQGVSRPIYNAQLSFAMPGTVFDIRVKPGQVVKAGELLMSLDSRAEDSRLELLDREIDNTIKIRTLETKIAQALLDKERYEEARRRNAATVMEAQHAKLAYDLSILALEEERFRIEQLKINRDELLAVRERMRLTAPCDGIVEDILVERGMAVDKNIPALRLVAIDPIQVDLTLPVDEAMLLKEGSPVTVTTRGGQVTEGTVVQVAKIAVLSNRTLKVRVHVPNPRMLPVGLMLDVQFPGVSGNATLK
jgi:RND family efflux transporter MFP subunit